MGLIDGIKGLRPGSKGEAVSKVDTTGQGMATQAAELRGKGESVNASVQNWPAGIVSFRDTPPPASEAQRIPAHAPDDAEVLNRLFRLGVEDI